MKNAVTAPNWPDWWIDAIKARDAVCDELRACRTQSEVDACAKKHKATYERLRDNPKTNVLAMHIQNLALAQRGPKLEPVFPKLKDATLDEAARNWPRMNEEFRAGDGFERGFSATILKGLRDPDWIPTEKQRFMMKKMYRDWLAATVTDGNVLEE